MVAMKAGQTVFLSADLRAVTKVGAMVAQTADNWAELWAVRWAAPKADAMAVSKVGTMDEM